MYFTYDLQFIYLYSLDLVLQPVIEDNDYYLIHICTNIIFENMYSLHYYIYKLIIPTRARDIDEIQVSITKKYYVMLFQSNYLLPVAHSTTKLMAKRVLNVVPVLSCITVAHFLVSILYPLFIHYYLTFITYFIYLLAFPSI